jgi:predicted nucleic acid-binding protein
MSVDSFIDSNILVYFLDKTAPDKQNKAEILITQAITLKNCCISYQVVQETLNVVIQKLNFNSSDADNLLNNILIPLWKVMPTQGLYQRGLKIQARYQYSFYDSLIIAAALESGCKILYSEDMQHGQHIEHVTIKNPFIE